MILTSRARPDAVAVAEGQDELDEFVYLDFDDALEIFAAIIGGSTQQAADQLRSPEAPVSTAKSLQMGNS